jgi:predicted house-cleaning noncanonical NTP pyrophosphatase (MazG superfamily)
MQLYCPQMRVDYNKLVRDRIPEIIRSRGTVTRILDQAVYRDALLAKLIEEAQEASDARAEELPAELADVLEVLQTLVKALGMSWEQLLALATEKRTRRADLEGRIFLEYTWRVESADLPLSRRIAGSEGQQGEAASRHKEHNPLITLRLRATTPLESAQEWQVAGDRGDGAQ